MTALSKTKVLFSTGTVNNLPEDNHCKSLYDMHPFIAILFITIVDHSFICKLKQNQKKKS